jgi:primosomal replication protein N
MLDVCNRSWGDLMPFPMPASDHCQVNLTMPIQVAGWEAGAVMVQVKPTHE